MANPHEGRFTWHELMTTDPEAATKFYGALLGWSVKEMDMGGEAGTYRMLSAGTEPVGGAMKAPPNVPSHWLPYVDATSTDAIVKKVGELGGKVLVPATDVPNMVRFAVAADPQGAAIGVVQSLGPNDQPVYDGPPRIGTFVWDELHTTDQDAAAKYYAALFGWTGKAGEEPMKYWHWQNNGKDIGGMMTLVQPGVPPNWLAYIAVSDVEASTSKVKALDGKVHMETMDIEHVGKFSVVADPTGAVFALFRSARV
jgi:hypothetical protein